MIMIVLVGLNHKTAPLDVRERLFAGCQETMHLPGSLLAIDGVSEALYLSTCNRVEIVANVEEDSQARAALKDYLIGLGALSGGDAGKCLYLHEGEEAIRHLFRVAASLDSLVMGEAQILGQVKDAYRQALAENATGVALNRLMHRAFRTAKRVRTETGIAANPVSVSFAAVELAKKIFGTLDGKKLLVIGRVFPTVQQPQARTRFIGSLCFSQCRSGIGISAELHSRQEYPSPSRRALASVLHGCGGDTLPGCTKVPVL